MVLVALVAFAASLVLISSNMAFSAEKAEKKEKASQAAPAKEEKKAEEKKEEQKVVCKFKNKDDMAEFEKLYIAKQATFGRMGVLQAYFSMEQNNLQEIDKQLEEKFKFKMDPAKMYDMNRDTMEIREVGNIPQQPAQQ
jgi:mannitol-specific phosphotransferase system IIBC component